MARRGRYPPRSLPGGSLLLAGLRPRRNLPECLPLLGSKRGLNETEEHMRGLAGGIGFEEGEIALKQGCYSALIKVEHVETDA